MAHLLARRSLSRSLIRIHLHMNVRERGEREKRLNDIFGGRANSAHIRCSDAPAKSHPITWVIESEWTRGEREVAKWHFWGKSELSSYQMHWHSSKVAPDYYLSNCECHVILTWGPYLNEVRTEGVLFLVFLRPFNMSDDMTPTWRQNPGPSGNLLLLMTETRQFQRLSIMTPAPCEKVMRCRMPSLNIIILGGPQVW